MKNLLAVTPGDFNTSELGICNNKKTQLLVKIICRITKLRILKSYLKNKRIPRIKSSCLLEQVSLACSSFFDFNLIKLCKIVNFYIIYFLVYYYINSNKNLMGNFHIYLWKWTYIATTYDVAWTRSRIKIAKLPLLTRGSTYVCAAFQILLRII